MRRMRCHQLICCQARSVQSLVVTTRTGLVGLFEAMAVAVGRNRQRLKAVDETLPDPCTVQSISWYSMLIVGNGGDRSWLILHFNQII